MTFILAGCPDPVAEAEDDLQAKDPLPMPALLECSPNQITAAKLIAQRTFERAKGKPTTVSVDFLTSPGEDVCVLLHTGAMTPNGELVRPAPASLAVSVDAIAIVGPDDVDAHPHVFTRWLGAGEIGAGLHTLSAELNGKPSSVLGVSVLAVSAEPSPGFSAVTYERLVDPSNNLTTVRDEMVVGGAPGMTHEKLQVALSGLSFTALVIGYSSTSPIFQVYVPGFSLGEAPDYIAAVEALPYVEYAGPHYASMLAMNAELFPPAGSDPVYLNDTNETTVIDESAAWHLTSIHAPAAWSEQHEGAPVGVLDAGFDMDLSDLAAATCVELGGDCSPTEGFAACTTVESCNDPKTCPGPGSDACTVAEGCWGPAKPVFHGNAVSGLIAGRSDDKGVVGVSWHSPLLLDVLGREDNVVISPLSDKDRHTSLLEVHAPLDRFAQHDPPARIINLNFGSRRLCPVSGKPVHDEDDENLTFYLDLTGLMMTTFLQANRDILIVEAAGNEGEKDVPSYEAGFGRRLLDPGFYARHPKADPSVQEQLLAVGSSTADNQVAAYTNPHGSRLLAPVGVPGANIMVLGASTLDLPEKHDGTSFAAPQVAGVASLMLAANPALAANHARSILLETAADVLPPPYKLLDAHAAVLEAKHWTCSGYSALGSVCPEFWDLAPQQIYFNSIQRLSCHCVLKGYPEGDFRPHQSINRAEMVKVVVEALYPQAEITKFEGKTSSFPDVPGDAWYGKYVALAEAHGFITGINGMFLPGNAVNRAEAVTILARAAYAMKTAGIAVPANSRVENLAARYVLHGGPDDVMPPQPLPKTFPDVAPTDWFYPSVEAIADLCIFGGTDQDQDPNTPRKFLPAQALDRGEAAHLACRTRFADDSKCSPKTCAKG